MKVSYDLSISLSEDFYIQDRTICYSGPTDITKKYTLHDFLVILRKIEMSEEKMLIHYIMNILNNNHPQYIQLANKYNVTNEVIDRVTGDIKDYHGYSIKKKPDVLSQASLL